MDDDDIIFAKRYSVAATHHRSREDILKCREIKVEYVNLRGVQKRVFRMYERHNASFGGVGWIVNDDIDECMVCGNEFYFFRRKHHCRSCGNLVCDSCSPEFVIVEELKEQGEVRVCVQCYWGQYPVYAAREWVDSDSEEEESEDDDLDLAITSSEINATINSSTKAINVEVEDFLEYCDLVVLNTHLPWGGVCSAIWSGLGMPAHMHGTFEYFVIVDEDGDEVSPNIADAQSFWEHAAELTVTNKNKLLACVPSALKQQLYQHRKNLLLEMKSPQGKGAVSPVITGVDDFVAEEGRSRDAGHAAVMSAEHSPGTTADSSRSRSSSSTSNDKGDAGSTTQSRRMQMQKRRSSISIEDEVLISLSRQRAQEREEAPGSTKNANKSASTSSSSGAGAGAGSGGGGGGGGAQEDTVSNNTDEEDAQELDEVDFSALALAEGPSCIVNVNEKDGTVVVQLKSGKTNKLSKVDSESLLLARRAITETFLQPPSSPAVLEMDTARVVTSETKSNSPPPSSSSGATTGEVNGRVAERGGRAPPDPVAAPTLISAFHKQLKKAFDELAQLSREENPEVREGVVSLSTFVKWSEVTRAISEIANMDSTVIEDEFASIASRGDKRDKSLVDFDGFCILMERLETLGERRSVFESKSAPEQVIRTSFSSGGGTSRRYSVSHTDLSGDLSELGDDSDDVVVPEELVREFEALEVLSKTAGGHHRKGERGVSVAAVLLWENIQEALAQDILEAEHIMALFRGAVEASRGEAAPAHALLTLREFYSFAVKLQVFVDQKCGAW